MPLMTLRSELLPAPFGPISAQISPRATSKLMSVTAATPRNESEIRSTPSSAPPISGRPPRLLGLELPDQRQDPRAEVGDVLEVVQEAAEDQVDADVLVGDDPLGDLRRRPDQAGLEAVVVLDEILE